MKIKMTTTLFATLLASSLHASETYNVEAGVAYATSSTDSNTNTNGVIFTGTYYLKPIALDTTQPFMELDFLQKASSISLSYTDLSIESDTLSKTTLNPIGIGGTFYVDKFLFGISHSNWNKSFSLKTNQNLAYDTKFTSTDIRLGYRVLPNTVVSFMNEQTDTTYTRNSITLPPIANVKTSTNGIRSYTVTSLNEGQSLVFDLEYKQIKREQNKNESNDEYSAKLRFYPQTNYFIEGGYRLNNGDVASDKGNTFELGAGYSFTPRLGVIFSTSQFNGDVSAEKSSSRTSSLTVGYRF